MNKAQKQRFEKAGWKIGTVSEFLELTAAEQSLIETKLLLGDAVRSLRKERHLSQKALAKLIGSSQPRVAKLENRDGEISLDFQMKAIFAARPNASREFSALIAKWRGPIASRLPAQRKAAIRSKAKQVVHKRAAAR